MTGIYCLIILDLIPVSFNKTVAALKTLADEGQIEHKKVAEAIKKYGLDPKKPNPMTV